MNKCFEKFPLLERKPDGSMYRMTLAQRKRARALILRNCCNCDDGNCLALDDGDACACPQIISFSVCCKHFRFAILPLDQTLEAEIFQGKGTKRCSVKLVLFLLCCPHHKRPIRLHRRQNPAFLVKLVLLPFTLRRRAELATRVHGQNPAFLVCRQVFIPGSNRGKYCPNCQKFVIQNQTAKRMKKMRKGRDALRIRGQKSHY